MAGLAVRGEVQDGVPKLHAEGCPQQGSFSLVFLGGGYEIGLGQFAGHSKARILRKGFYLEFVKN